MPLTYDLVVVGGGIHGCASAALAAAGGLKVLLIEQDDLASKTSSASSKLIHGGLRYLEHAEFRLVYQALRARKRLLSSAPHLVHPLAFVLPLTALSRPMWQIRLGLCGYDLLARHQAFPPSRMLNRIQEPGYFSPLRPNIQKAALYFDAQADDARLTIENALQAKHHGANILTNTALKEATVTAGHWTLTLRPRNGRAFVVHARAIVNTAGPWVNEVHRLLQTPSYPAVRWVKGSHVLLPAFYSEKHAYLLQHEDKRVIFCLPYHGHTLIGTTDETVSSPSLPPTLSDQETHYFSAIIARYFHPTFHPDQIKAHWTGIRTLLDTPNRSPQALSREQTIHYSATPAPVVSLYGGKLTTHQYTAEKLLQALTPHFPAWRTPTLGAFPGAQCPAATSYATYIRQLKGDYAWLPPRLLQRYLSTYGTRITQLLKHCHAMPHLGKELAPLVYAKEIQFLSDEEWVTQPDDLLWRRTKLGIQLSKQEQTQVYAFFK